jgi:hypothetical protein
VRHPLFVVIGIDRGSGDRTEWQAFERSCRDRINGYGATRKQATADLERKIALRESSAVAS